MYSLKRGNGGHGLEVFNDETGKYEKVSIDFEGKQIDGWEGLVELALDPADKAIYDSLPDSNQAKQQISEYLQNQYEQLLQGKIDELNKNLSGQKEVKFYGEDIQSFINDFDNMFSPEFFSGLQTEYDKSPDPYDMVHLAYEPNDYSVPLIQYMVQKEIFKNAKATEISENEFNSLIDEDDRCNATGDKNRDADIMREYQEGINRINTHKNLQLYRFTRAPSKDWNNILKGMYAPDEDTPDCYLSSTSTGYSGTVMYSTMSDSYISGGWGNGLTVKMVVNPADMKILDFGKYRICRYKNGDCPAIDNFFINRITIANKFKSLLVKNGVKNADELSGRFNEMIGYRPGYRTTVSDMDIGLVANLLGYDAIFCDGHQLNILNMNKVKVVDKVY